MRSYSFIRRRITRGLHRPGRSGLITSGVDFLPENGRPAESEYHANYYQRSDLFLKGVAIQGAEHNELVEPFETPLPLKHVTVDDVETIVKTDLRLRLWDRLPVP